MPLTRTSELRTYLAFMIAPHSFVALVRLKPCAMAPVRRSPPSLRPDRHDPDCDLEHQFGAAARRGGEEISPRGRPGRTVPARDQDARRTFPARGLRRSGIRASAFPRHEVL